MNRRMSHGQAIRSVLGRWRVTHFTSVFSHTADVVMLRRVSAPPAREQHTLHVPVGQRRTLIAGPATARQRLESLLRERPAHAGVELNLPI